MAQIGAFNWANGLTDGNNYHPIWDYRRILAHYYSNIEFQGVPDIRNDYRFNAIQISNFSTGQNDYIFYDTNRRKDDIALILQNTGTLSWLLGWEPDFSCKPASYNIALSYHIYDETTGQIACGDPNVPGGNPCFEGVRNYMCVPFSGGGTPPGGSFIIQGVTVDLPAQLPLDKCYILRWDIELARNHNQTTWISRLQQNPWLAQWPTQDIRFCYVRQSGGGDPNPPQNPTATSGHTVNAWSNNPNMTIAWSPPGGGPVSGYEYRYQGNGSDLGSGWQATTQTQTPSFNITQDGNHSLKVRSVLGGNKSSSVTTGPYLIDRRSPSLSISRPVPNWVTTNQITLNWTGTDTGVSGQISDMSHYDVYYATSSAGPWTPLVLSITQETASIIGNDDQYYYFKVIAYDRAGNSTEKQKTVQVRTFPYLSVSAAPSLNWTVTLSNTAPSVRSLQILNNGGKVMTWTAQTDFPYLTLPLTNGLDDSTMPITLTHPLTYGTFSGVLTVTGTTDTRDSPTMIPVNIRIIDQFRYYLPIIFKQ